MITEKTTISGTEEELLAYFKEKYNLVENNSKPVQEASKELPVTANGNSTSSINPAVVGNKVTTGFSGLFDGTSWGNK